MRGCTGPCASKIGTVNMDLFTIAAIVIVVVLIITIIVMGEWRR